jgi:hypothetical protein
MPPKNYYSYTYIICEKQRLLILLKVNKFLNKMPHGQFFYPRPAIWPGLAARRPLDEQSQNDIMTKKEKGQLT